MERALGTQDERKEATVERLLSARVIDYVSHFMTLMNSDAIAELKFFQELFNETIPGLNLRNDPIAPAAALSQAAKERDVGVIPRGLTPEEVLAVMMDQVTKASVEAEVKYLSQTLYTDIKDVL